MIILLHRYIVIILIYMITHDRMYFRVREAKLAHNITKDCGRAAAVATDLGEPPVLSLQSDRAGGG